MSGGEPLLQIDFLLELFKLAKQKGVHTVIAVSYTHLFLTYLGKHGTCTGTKLNGFIFQQAATKLVSMEIFAE